MSAGESLPTVAVLHARYGTRASYYDDWLDAFARARALRVESFNAALAKGRRRFARRVREFDVLVLLHSCTADTMDFADALRPALQARRGTLVAFVGNEVNLPGSPMAPKIAFLGDVGADIVATQLLREAGEWLYAGTGARVLALPHALNPDAFPTTAAPEQRAVDIGARSFRYLPHLGDDDRNRLLDYFASTRFEPALRVDISTSERFTRTDWCAFLNRCRGTVSNEAGSFYLERDDATLEAIRAWLLARQRAHGGLLIRADSPLRRLARKLPWSVKQRLARWLASGPVRHESLASGEVSFAEVHERFFRDRPAAPVYGKCISSRHFDAIGTRTCQIMFAGRFNDLLRAGEHYLALAPDFSNVDEVLRRFRDRALVTEMVGRTREYVLDAHTYDHRIRALVAALG